MCLTRSSVASLAIALLIAGAASSARAQVPATGVMAFTGARVIDGTGAAPIEQATIVITNGRITAIGASSSVMPPAGATVTKAKALVARSGTGGMKVTFWWLPGAPVNRAAVKALCRC